MEHARHFADGVFYGVGDALAGQISIAQTVGEIGDRAFSPRRLGPEALHGRECDGGLSKGVLRGFGGNIPVPQVGRIAETESDRTRRGSEPGPGLSGGPPAFGRGVPYLGFYEDRNRFHRSSMDDRDVNRFG